MPSGPGSFFFIRSNVNKRSSRPSSTSGLRSPARSATGADEEPWWDRMMSKPIACMATHKPVGPEYYGCRPQNSRESIGSSHVHDQSEAGPVWQRLYQQPLEKEVL